MNLSQADLGNTYTITAIETSDDELNSFLFSLGCYTGECIAMVAKVSGGYVVSIRDGRYNIDKSLAEAILVA